MPTETAEKERKERGGEMKKVLPACPSHACTFFSISPVSVIIAAPVDCER
jgi:hypothetical protein